MWEFEPIPAGYRNKFLREVDFRAFTVPLSKEAPSSTTGLLVATTKPDAPLAHPYASTSNAECRCQKIPLLNSECGEAA